MRKFQVVFLLIIGFILLSACGSIVPKQPSITDETPLQIPETRGSIRIPLEINLQPYFELADKSIDKTFQGKVEQCDGVSFQYYFKRKPLEFNGTKQTLAYKINGEYNIRANYCAQCSSVFGSDPFCLTPRIYVSCGVGEPLRKIAIDFQSDLSIESNYLLNSKTRLAKVETMDPCELTFLKYDASQLIEKEMTAYLQTMEKEIDGQIRKVDLKTPINQAWAAMQEAMKIPNLGYLYFQPKAIEIEPISFKNQTAKVIVNMELSLLISTNPVEKPKQNLPFLSRVKSEDEFNLPLLTLASYDSINSILKKEVAGLIIPFKKKKIIVTEAEALGPVGKQLLFKVKFTGSKKGTIYLLGTPTYDGTKQEISFPDLTFDIRSKDALLKSAKWLFDKKLTDAFRAKAKYDLSDQIEKARKEIEKELNTSIEYSKGQKVFLSGKLNQLNFSNLQVGPNELRIVIDLSGNLSLKL
jgi:hypothetical protein